ncbi:MAG: DNA adenine methylase [Spirochaetota bacterium]|nr:DNA adenine methylase [Spirochaetota bacterium]
MIINLSNDAKNYIESQLIAYIGNKRRLLPLIHKAFEQLDIDPLKDYATFYDPFAGSGVVSRFAKCLGFKVIANDWELYSQIINKTYLEIDEREVDDLFKEYGNIKTLIKGLNKLPALPANKSYISRYYCPKDTNNPDLVNERLFYTKETGEKLDSIREAIDKIGLNNPSKQNKKVKNLLLALLLHEAATRANTSGVFKGFHNGFGGTGKDALSRILKPLSLKTPKLYNGKHKSKVFKCCANKLSKKLKSRIRFDVAYIDPPYNQHQYGSNYHLLNTIALNDKPPVNDAIYINGKKVDKSAIRKDWIKTKSAYCYKSTAQNDFENLIDNINAKYILVSYSIDGIIPFDNMLNILSHKGKLDIITSEYTKYRGGKQALTSEKSNIEFLLLIDTSKKKNTRDIIRVKECLINQKINLYIKKTIDIINLSIIGFHHSEDIDEIKVYEKIYDKRIIKITVVKGYHFAKDAIKWSYSSAKNNVKSWISLPLSIKEQLANDLNLITSITKDREIEILLNFIKNSIYASNKTNITNLEKEIMSYYGRIPHLLKKFNNKKAYIQSLKTIHQILIVTSIIRSELSALYYSKIFYQKLNKLKSIIENKINHKSNYKHDEINLLKSSVIEQYNNILGAA